LVKEQLPEALRAEYTRVAYYYYKVALTQEQISKKMNMSRQRVNRILKDCVERGIVKISIEGMQGAQYELEASLEQKYSLLAARVTECGEPEIINSVLGTTAGEYLAQILDKGDIIGFSRGRAVSCMVDNMPPVAKKHVVATQLMGGWNHAESAMDVDDIVHRFSQKSGASAKVLFAPVMVNNPNLKQSIISEPYFQGVYEFIKSCTIAVVGIGGMPSEKQKNERKLCSVEEAFLTYGALSAVGEVCTHFFDESGNPVRSRMDDRIIAIALDDYLQIPHRIGVAGSPTKLQAITGALRGGYINVLITDPNTAQALDRA